MGVVSLGAMEDKKKVWICRLEVNFLGGKGGEEGHRLQVDLGDGDCSSSRGTTIQCIQAMVLRIALAIR